MKTEQEIRNKIELLKEEYRVSDSGKYTTITGSACECMNIVSDIRILKWVLGEATWESNYEQENKIIKEIEGEMK